jgi:hypothetical protein
MDLNRKEENIIELNNIINELIFYFKLFQNKKLELDN